MKLAAEILDLKITSLFSFMILMTNYIDIKMSYQIISGAIFIGYNLHRWYIMYVNHKESRKNNNSKSKKP